MGKFSSTAPDRNEAPALSALGVELHPDAMSLVADGKALADSFGGSGERSTD